MNDQNSNQVEADYPRINRKFLRDLVKKIGGYVTPELNDKLYLHFKGFRQIEGLDEYTGLKVLWLEGNAIAKIENLHGLKELKYLHQNVIEKIENLEQNEALHTLNVSDNFISKIENLHALSQLHTLQISNNNLRDLQDVEGLKCCRSLGVLDLSNNRIEDPGIIDILKELPQLGVLNLMGNPVIGKIESYRKIMICNLKRLTYLDDRPVFPEERRTAEAWGVGGVPAEIAEREKIREEERTRDQRNWEALEQLQREWREGNQEGKEEEGEVPAGEQPDSLEEEEPGNPNVRLIQVKPKSELAEEDEIYEEKDEEDGPPELEDDPDTKEESSDESDPGFEQLD